MSHFDAGWRPLPKILSVRSGFIEFEILTIKSSNNQHYYGKVMGVYMTYILASKEDGIGPCRKLHLRSLQSRYENFIFCDVFIFINKRLKSYGFHKNWF